MIWKPIKHDYCPYETNFPCIFYPCENTKNGKFNCRTKVTSESSKEEKA